MLINAAGPSYTCVWVASLLVTVLHGIRLCMGCLHIRLLLSQPANTIEPCDALEVPPRSLDTADALTVSILCKFCIAGDAQPPVVCNELCLLKGVGSACVAWEDLTLAGRLCCL